MIIYILLYSIFLIKKRVRKRVRKRVIWVSGGGEIISGKYFEKKDGIISRKYFEKKDGIISGKYFEKKDCIM